jgi:glycosyltransferase involved in cell wall biosynthesis
MKKIAFLLPSLKFGGAEKAVVTLADAFARNGYQIDMLLMSREGELLDGLPKEIRVIDLKCDRTFKLPFKIINYLTANRPQVLISSFFKLNVCVCLARMAVWNQKVVLWEHSYPSRTSIHSSATYMVGATALYWLATAVVGVSEGVTNDISRLTLGLDKKIHTIGNPIAPPSVPDVPLTEVRESKDTVHLLSLGRLVPVKNHHLLLEAFALLSGSLACTLSIVGDGPLRAELEQSCSRLGINETVSFHGYQPNPYLFMVNCDVLVVSSVSEGLGNVVIEAFQVGLKVVSTNCGAGIRSILGEGRLGTISPAATPVALMQAIESELTQERSRKELQEAVRDYHPDKVAEKVRSLFQLVSG